MDSFESILIVGFGTMAGAMVEGWLAAGMPANRFSAYDPFARSAPDGVRLVTQWPEERFDLVLLAVKPQKLSDVAVDLEPLVGPGTVLISVLAGVELETLAERFPRAGELVRLMPNLAASLGKAPNALVSRGLDEAARARITALAEALGSTEWLPDERQFELVTALTGSGPGFVYRFIDALAAGAIALGLERDRAERLAVRMVEGAAALAAASPHSPGELARRVASPGGMTQRGLDVLDADGALAALVRETLRATRDRGAEMAREVRGEG